MSTRTSTFSSSTTFIDGNNGGSRLLIQISDAACTGGVTAGDVIHYDAVNSLYKKSIADNPPNSEVFGIVESVNPDASKNVVIYGSINLPASAIEDIPVGSTGAGGNADIFFLSPTTEGKLRNTTPTETTQIIKPIYQVAPHGSYTGVVMNYIGYKVPSDINIFTPQSRLAPIGTVNYFLNNIILPTINSNHLQLDGSQILDNSNNEYEQFKNKYGNYFGKFVAFRFQPSTVTVTWQGNAVYPTWNPSSYPDRFVVVDLLNTTLFSETLTAVLDTVNRLILFNDIYSYNAINPNVGGLLIGQQLGLIKNPWSPPTPDKIIGGIVLTELIDSYHKLTVPYIESALRIFSFFDQDDNLIPNAQSSLMYSSIIKVRNQENVNTVRSLEANTVNTENFILGSTDLMTTLNDLESRILLAEQEINK